MSWVFLVALVVCLALALALVVQRGHELRKMVRVLSARSAAIDGGRDRPRLLAPQIDLSRCAGCGLCIAVCPEEGVLAHIHGQAVLVDGERCQSHGLCAAACPMDAIALTHLDLARRRDIPALQANLEVPHVPGLFLAGEVTGQALIRSAVAQVEVALAHIAARERSREADESHEDYLDLCIVGAGPAGLAASLQARALELSFVTLEQERLGGTVAAYPRRKLIMTEALELPLGERLERASYSKEELMEIWERLAARHELPIRESVRVEAVERTPHGFRVETSAGSQLARSVLLACGRRGSPRKLRIPGEELPKVSYSLLDARSCAGRRVLVVGGGDSAVEAALALAEIEACEVVLAYRGADFFRLTSRNESRLHIALEEARLQVLRATSLLRIEPQAVLLRREVEGAASELWLPNDDVFVLVGGRPPFELLERAGVSFDPADRSAQSPTERTDTGLVVGLAAAFAAALLALGLAWLWRDYYSLEMAQRPQHPRHALLAPAAPVGLAFGILATTLLAVNLAYLLRRTRRLGFVRGTLARWMNVHVATGFGALSLALLHAAMSARDSVGGQALWGLVALVVTGVIGRHVYARVPRAANGRELEIEEVRAELASAASEWRGDMREHGTRLFARTLAAVRAEAWGDSFLGRLRSLLTTGRREARYLRELRVQASADGLSHAQTEQMLTLARRAWKASVSAVHLEELRSLIAGWRYLHRWGALLVAALLLAHILASCLYAGFLWGSVG